VEKIKVTTGTVIVNVIELVEKDYWMIRNIMLLASSKDHTYRLATDSQEQADIVIANAEDLVTMGFWSEYRQKVPEANALLVSSNSSSDWTTTVSSIL
jgi:hypothetical protein